MATTERSQESTRQNLSAQTRTYSDEVREKLAKIAPSIREAVHMVDKDRHSPKSFAAVVGEVESKLDKLIRILDESDEVKTRDSLIELEQAADSARVAAQNDHDSSPETRHAVVKMHHEVGRLKREEVTRH